MESKTWKRAKDRAVKKGQTIKIHIGEANLF